MIPQTFNLEKCMLIGQQIHRMANEHHLTPVEVVAASILAAYVASTGEVPDRAKALRIISEISMNIVLIGKEGLIGQ